jgi:hypothetical protein
MAELSNDGTSAVPLWLYYWIRFGIPVLIVVLFVWWLLTEVLKSAAAA